jgi:16S rRNA processing protein RimM
MSPRAGARICVAQIGAPHGVRGEVRLKAFTEDPAAVAQYGPLETEDGSARIEIEALRPGKTHLVARLRGIADRDAAERMTNVRLYVPRERLPPPEDDDTFYYADLIGLTAVDRSGAKIGTVVAVQNFGASDLLEIAPDKGGVSVLLPFTAAVVPQVDIAFGCITVEPPAGTFEDGTVQDTGSRT